MSIFHAKSELIEKELKSFAEEKGIEWKEFLSKDCRRHGPNVLQTIADRIKEKKPEFNCTRQDIAATKTRLKYRSTIDGQDNEDFVLAQEKQCEKTIKDYLHKLEAGFPKGMIERVIRRYTGAE